MTVRERTPRPVLQTCDGLQRISAGEREPGVALKASNTIVGNIISSYGEPIVDLRDWATVHHFSEVVTPRVQR